MMKNTLLALSFVMILFNSFNTWANKAAPAPDQTVPDSEACLARYQKARETYAQDRTNMEALQIIADCSEGAKIGKYAKQTREIFEKSEVLSIIPFLLEKAQIRDLIPILNEVELKENKTMADYLLIQGVYERLGETEKQIQILKSANLAAPNDPRPLMLLAQKLRAKGEADEAATLLRGWIGRVIDQPQNFYLLVFALALAYPLVLGLFFVCVIWSLATLLVLRRVKELESWRELRLVLPIFLITVPPVLALRFYQTLHPVALLGLVVIGVALVLVILSPWLGWVVWPFRMLKRGFGILFDTIRLAEVLHRLSSAHRVLLSLLAIFLLAAVVPTLQDVDVQVALMIVASLVLYTSIGSLMVTFLRSRESLLVSLRWISVLATFPFLVSYLVSDWSSLGAPLLMGELPTARAIEGFASYVLFWGISFFAALHLGKIVAHAFAEPVIEMTKTVQEIEKGHFDTKVTSMSRDEIGQLAMAFNKMADGLKKRDLMEKTFRKYIDPQIAERIMEGAATEIRVEGEVKDAVVLFADVRGFTGFTTQMPPQELLRILNEFFTEAVRIVQAKQGVIDKFIGDNLMAVWGVPTAVEGAEKKAIAAALEIIEVVAAMDKKLQSQGFPPFAVGVGINAGPVVAGSLGSQDHMEYTVIGDTVNMAQRAESAAQKQQLVITAQVYERVKDAIQGEPLPNIKVKGVSELQTWWTVGGLSHGA